MLRGWPGWFQGYVAGKGAGPLSAVPISVSPSVQQTLTEALRGAGPLRAPHRQRRIGGSLI